MIYQVYTNPIFPQHKRLSLSINFIKFGQLIWFLLQRKKLEYSNKSDYKILYCLKLNIYGKGLFPLKLSPVFTVLFSQEHRTFTVATVKIFNICELSSFISDFQWARIKEHFWPSVEQSFLS